MGTTKAYKLPIHEHPLSPSARFSFGECHGCHVKTPIYGGYFCYESCCYSWFHKECAKAPLEINHPSHPEHPLLLTKDFPSKDGLSDCCGKNLLSPCYTCPTCEYKVDFVCGIKPSPPAIEHPMCHDHALEFLKKREDQEEVTCEVCKEYIGGPSYSCLECHVYFHIDCVHLSKEIYHPCHSSHPLIMVIASQSITYDDDDDYVEKSCRFCSVQPEKVFYHCSICNFTMCLRCTKHPPPLVIEHSKTHAHPLRLVSSKIAFTCKICGGEGYNTKPYMCNECDFFLGGDCIDLPRVININRHEHRISFRHHLSQGRLKCGVCRRSISRYYGAYSCLVCPKYAVHSLCAVNISVWDGMELEGIPESRDDIAPYKVVGDNLISHFSHAMHTLRLYKDINCQVDEYIRCEVCIRPIWCGSVYSCEECLFFLHEKCANLPKKKKLVFDATPYTLEYVKAVYCCKICGMFCAGFLYTSHGLLMAHHYVDVHCGSISEPLDHAGHLHPLYFDKKEDHECNACKKLLDDYMLRCDDCDFDLCLYCATLPEKVWHQSHEHPVTLYCGGQTSCGENWCEICEMDLDSNKWFFTCSVCGVNLHVQCVLGDFSRLKPELLIFFGGRLYKVVLNNSYTRPVCSHCHCRCTVSVILKEMGETKVYICSSLCLSSFLGIKFFTHFTRSRPAHFGPELFG